MDKFWIAIRVYDGKPHMSEAFIIPEIQSIEGARVVVDRLAKNGLAVYVVAEAVYMASAYADVVVKTEVILGGPNA